MHTYIDMNFAKSYDMRFTINTPFPDKKHNPNFAYLVLKFGLGLTLPQK